MAKINNLAIPRGGRGSGPPVPPPPPDSPMDAAIKSRAFFPGILASNEGIFGTAQLKTDKKSTSLSPDVQLTLSAVLDEFHQVIYQTHV